MSKSTCNPFAPPVFPLDIVAQRHDNDIFRVAVAPDDWAAFEAAGRPLNHVFEVRLSPALFGVWGMFRTGPQAKFGIRVIGSISRLLTDPWVDTIVVHEEVALTPEAYVTLTLVTVDAAFIAARRAVFMAYDKHMRAVADRGTA